MGDRECKKDNRRILDDDRDVILHRPAPDEGLAPDEEDLKEHEQSKKLATSNEDYVDLVEKGPVLETSGGNATKFSCTSENRFRRRRKAKVQISFISTVFYDGTFLQISVVGSVEVDKNFILNCTCRGICEGNKIWTRGLNNKELAYNQWVLKDKIEIIQSSYEEFSIRVLKANKTDIESNYTCLQKHSPTQSPTVASTAQKPISTPQQPKKSNTGEIGGKVFGALVGVGVL
ncbi:unnamed protein product [Mytilus edulis]|uniref:Uncharacterized protein n=1 Tax=Mytilus edulis TaxID=6550 RepID=A0A8S3RS81_MYTED|nr:unnamed protein product [Mytilus edulis]